MKARRALGWSIGLVLGLGACAHEAGRAGREAGRGATAGALQSLAQGPAAPATQELGERVAAGALTELSKPESLERIRSLAATSVAGALSGAAGGGRRSPARRALSGVGGTGAVAAPTSPAGALATEVGRGFTLAFVSELRRELGRGDGPLADAFVTTAERASAAAVRGSWSTLGWIPVAVAFAAGALLTALLAWALSLSRSVRRLTEALAVRRESERDLR